MTAIFWSYRATILPLFFLAKLLPIKSKKRPLAFSKTEIPNNLEGALWFHFASSGEFEQVLPVIEEIKKVRNLPIVLTYFSNSARGALEREVSRRKTPLWDFASSLPWDFSSELKEYFEKIKPSQLVLVHRELWPGLLYWAKVYRVPVSLLGWAGKAKGKFWLGSFLKSLEKIATVSSLEKGELKQKFPHLQVEALGDPRVDRVWRRKEGLVEKKSSKPTFLMGSLHWKDWQIISQAIEKKDWLRDWRWIFVPHDLDKGFIEKIEKFLVSEGRIFKRLSNAEKDWDGDLIVDSVGHLFSLYPLANVVFVGGSFDEKVHNVLEPAVFGKAILVGPKIQNSHEAQQMLDQEALLTSSNSIEFQCGLEMLIKDPALRSHLGSNASTYISASLGSAPRISTWLLTPKGV